MLKKKYYLFIENTREFNLNLIKIKNKFNIIYRNQKTIESIEELKAYRKNCKKNGVNFFVANDTKLLSKINADGLYISAHNKSLHTNIYSKKGFSFKIYNNLKCECSPNLINGMDSLYLYSSV